MTILEKIASLTAENTLFELHKMLDSQDFNVFISWWGQRVVSIKGYTGSVKINDLCQKYLSTIQATNEQTLKTRLRSVELWDRMKSLYDESETKLDNTFLYKYIVPLIENCLHDCLYISDSKGIHKEPLKYQFLEFSEEEFKRHWPDQDPIIPHQKRIVLDPKDVFTSPEKIKQLWYASKEMMQKALASNCKFVKKA